MTTISDLAVEVKDTFKPTQDIDVPFVGLEHVEQNSLRLSGHGSSKSVDSNKYFFKKGDILFGTLRPYFRKLIVAPMDGVCSTEFSVIRPKNPVDRNYVFYCLAQGPFIEYATTNSNGARPRTKWDLFSDFEVEIFDEPYREKLGQLLRNYDDLIENNRRRIALLEEAARLLYREWFVHFCFPGAEHVKISEGLPEGWVRTTLGEFSPFKYGKALKAGDRQAGDVPVYGSSGFVGSHNKTLVDTSSIVIGRKGNVGSVFWAERGFWPIDTVYFIEPEQASLFLFQALQNVSFINTDVAVPGLNRNMAHSREIVIPNKSILDEFEEIAGTFQNQISVLRKQVDELAKARDLLVPRLMDGRLEI